MGDSGLYDWSGAPLYPDVDIPPPPPAAPGGGLAGAFGGGLGAGASSASSSSSSAAAAPRAAAPQLAAGAAGGKKSGAVEWVPDAMVKHCQQCEKAFSATRRKHHCRRCGGIFCWECSTKKFELPPSFGFPKGKEQRVCDACYSVLEAVRDSERHSTSSDTLSAQFHLRAKGGAVAYVASCGPVGRRDATTLSALSAAGEVGDVATVGKKVYVVVQVQNVTAVTTRVLEASLGRRDASVPEALQAARRQVPPALEARMRSCGSNTEWMMTLVSPPAGAKLPVPFTATVQRLVQIVSIAHPFLVPVFDLEWIARDGAAAVGGSAGASGSSSSGGGGAGAGGGVAQEEQLAVIEPCFHKVGSLRDLIYKSAWRAPYAEKYLFSAKDGTKLRGTPLPVADIQRFGLQVLLALSFLRSVQLLPQPAAHVWLHAGNVMIDQPGNTRTRTALLTGWWHGTMLSLPPPSAANNAAAASVPPTDASAEVAAFGLLLFEMAFGVSLATAMSDYGSLTARECVQAILGDGDGETDAAASAPAEEPAAAAAAAAGGALNPPAPAVADVLRLIFLGGSNGLGGEGGEDEDEAAVPTTLQVEDILVAQLFLDAQKKQKFIAQPSVAALFDGKVKSAISKLNAAAAGEVVLPSAKSRLRRTASQQQRASARASARERAAAAAARDGTKKTSFVTAGASASVTPAAAPAAAAPAASTAAAAPAAAAPAAPAPPAAAPRPPPAASSGRGALLDSIQKGKSLKKAVTNDRSGPRV